MIAMTQYKCEICGTVYTDEDVCRKCETSHIKPKRIKNSAYQSLRSKNSKYPFRITVEMSDGESICYHR